ncbi:MAG: V-type ATPase 116kDa subunit family protein [Halobacteriota archaeon]
MLKPVEMRELRIVTLNDLVDGVIKRIDALGSVHLTDIKEFLGDWEGLIEPSKADVILMKTSELLARIDNLIALLRPGEEAKKSLRETLFKAPEEVGQGQWQAEKINVEEIRLDDVEKDFGELERTVTTLIDKNERLSEELSTTKELLLALKALEDFGANPDFVGEHEFISVYAGKLPDGNLDELKTTLETITGGNHLVVSKQITEGETEGGAVPVALAFVLIAALKTDKEEVERVLTRLDFESPVFPEHIPDSINDAIQDTATRIQRLESDIRENESEIEEIRGTRFKDLLVMQELVQIEESKAKAKVLFGKSEHVRVIEGWAPKQEVERIIEGINEETGGFSVVEVIEPKREDVRVPSLLNNPRIIKPFESVIKMYGHPLYKDIDPTLITAIMFPVLFGLMFPDMGHGFFILLLGLALMFAFKGLGKEMQGMGIIIVLCGFCSLIVGIIFGEFFGFSTYASHLVAQSTNMHIPGWLILIKEPLMEPLVQVELFFVLTMLIGAVHMGLGLFLHVANKISNKDTFEVISGFVKIWCLFGALYFLLLLFGFYFTELKEGNTQVLLRNMVIFLLLPILSLFVLKIISELKHEAGVGGGEEASNADKKEKRGFMDYLIILIDGVIDALLENFFRFLANIVSYGRILALALCHAALIEVFILLTFMCLQINPTIGPVIAAVVFLLGTAVVIILEAIMAGIHTIRLHFYEWFTKFYEGGGVEFSPFKFRRTYTY